MDTQTNAAPPQGSNTLLPDSIAATPLTPLQLNSYKLDAKHTVLTPEYLEGLGKTTSPTQSDK